MKKMTSKKMSSAWLVVIIGTFWIICEITASIMEGIYGKLKINYSRCN